MQFKFCFLIFIFFTQKLFSAQNTIKTEGFSLAPIFAANSTYGILLGGATFYNNKSHETELWGVYTMRAQHFAHIGYRYNFKPFQIGFLFRHTNFFEAYFPRGSELHQNFNQIQNQKFFFIPTFLWHITDDYQLELSTDTKNRKEKNRIILPDSSILEARVAPDENTTLLGTKFIADFRTKNLISSLGSYFSIKFGKLPSKSWTNLKDSPLYATQISEARYYHEILEDKMVLAGKIEHARSYEKPTYNNEFYLGGASLLRGFKTNRFRGNKYLLLTTESRNYLNQYLSSVLFYEVGAINSYNIFQKPLHAYGFGMRIGLPPDFIKLIRMDFGFGAEGLNFSMEFGQVF